MALSLLCPQYFPRHCLRRLQALDAQRVGLRSSSLWQASALRSDTADCRRPFRHRLDTHTPARPPAAPSPAQHNHRAHCRGALPWQWLLPGWKGWLFVRALSKQDSLSSQAWPARAVRGRNPPLPLHLAALTPFIFTLTPPSPQSPPHTHPNTHTSPPPPTHPLTPPRCTTQPRTPTRLSFTLVRPPGRADATAGQPACVGRSCGWFLAPHCVCVGRLTP